ncbi:MAG: erythronate-4-phosphate dehydrogenase [SAR86 cluster bacterium]|jgi:erythronate-4-phosphate dehydrogenase|nr:MAG: erythronate-4-phosphate dehydrogenase [SAR86 cluster bacterium]|tara:strand:+ start:3696 stop:4739 length:1044 start_codon:yes stop_codon:yes gene_type:complete
MIVVVDKDIKKFKEITSIVEEFSDIEFNYLEDKEINNKKIKNADVLFVRSTTNISENLLKESKIKLVGSATSGIDHLDTNYLESKGINWFYSPGCNSISVMNYVLSCINFLFKEKYLRRNDSIGIIGCGNIGNLVRLALNKFKISVKVFDPYITNEHSAEYKDLIKCKLLTFHVPLTMNHLHATYKMINKEFISKMKPSIIINTSRGEIAKEKDIIDSNLIYLSDVWVNEPEPSIDILNRSIISTPHVAGHSMRGKLNGTLKLIFELMRFLKIDINKTNEYEKKIISLINFEESKIISSIEQIDTLYDVEKESSSFKKKLIGSNHRIKKKTFNLIRSQHKERQEYIL